MAENATKTDDAHAAHGDGHDDHDHSLPLWMLGGTLAALMVLTVITVAAAYVDLGDLNVPIAMLIATIKATLVALIFMHLRWDKPFNTVILLTSLGMLALFLTIASIDTSEYQQDMDASFGEKWMASERKRLKDDLKVDTLYPREEHGKETADAKTGEAQTPAPAGMDAAAVKKLRQWAARTLGALPKVDAQKGLEDPKAKLGQLLYWDPRISKSNTISCNSCHPLDNFGQDGKKTSPGHDGTVGTRNSPTVFNAFLQDVGQFWDARVPDVEAQAVEPIKNPIEHGMTEASAVAALKAIPGYAPLFKKAFPDDDDPITLANFGVAVGAFERLLVTRSRFDTFMEGNDGALKPEEVRGLQVYKASKCITCHTGPAIGGNMKQKLGLVVPYETKDKGLAEQTKQKRHEYIFKVSQLRNITKTGPYLHDGSIASLEETIKIMVKHQLEDVTINDEQMKDLIAFLNSTTADIDPALKKKPELPK